LAPRYHQERVAIVRKRDAEKNIVSVSTRGSNVINFVSVIIVRIVRRDHFIFISLYTYWPYFGPPTYHIFHKGTFFFGLAGLIAFQRTCIEAKI